MPTKTIKRAAAANPNATAGGVSGAGAVLLVWALSLIGLTIDSVAAAAITATATTVVLYVGRHGLVGVWRRIWRGSDT